MFFSGASVFEVCSSSIFLGILAFPFWNRFLYDGERIQEDDTPSSLDMEDNGEPLHSSLLLMGF